jgi:hypothetical protein
LGGALTLENGIIVINLAAIPGLDQSTGLMVKLHPTNPCLTLAAEGLAFQPRASASGLAVNGPGAYVVAQNPIFVDGSGIGLNRSASYFALSGSDLVLANPITGLITSTSNIVLAADAATLYLGAGSDASLKYDGVDCVLDSSLVTPSDLVVACGTAKTLRLGTPVWNDINTAGTVLSVLDIATLRDEFVDSTGTDTGIETWALEVGDGVSGSFEIAHDYKEGTVLFFHVHWQGVAVPTCTENVRWKLIYTLAREGVVLTPATPIEIETPFDTQYEFARSSFAAISGTNIEVGDQFLFRLERIAATGGDEFVGGALLATVGIHYQVDTLGSRQVSTK